MVIIHDSTSQNANWNNIFLLKSLFKIEVFKDSVTYATLLSLLTVTKQLYD